MESSYNWGLIGPGRFAREFADELRKNERARCVGVASRSIEKAISFANEFGFARAYGSYEEIVKDNEIDVIYVVVPHVFHRKITEMALNAGKAVLCKKPLAPCYSETWALTKSARDRGVFLMEAMKTGFLPAIREARRWVDDGKIGTPKILKADFCFSGPIDPDDRLMNPDLGGGAVLDVGIYPLYLALHFLGEISSLHAGGSITKTGVDDSAAVVTKHAGGGLGVLSSSFQSNGEAMDAEILGTEGSVRLPVFHKATRGELWKGSSLVECFEDDSGGMVKGEIDAVMDSLDRGETENPGHTHADHSSLAETLDSVRDAIGLL